MFKKSVKKEVSRFFMSFCIFFIALSSIAFGVKAEVFVEKAKDWPHVTELGTADKAEKYAPGEILVKFKPGLSKATINSINSAFGTSILDAIPQIDVYRIEIPSDVTVPEMIKKYLSLPEVEFAEPNGIYTLDTVPNDPYYGNQWALPIIEAPDAWDIRTRGRDIVIAIVDTGVDLYHPDLVNRVLSGYDFVNRDSDPMDDNGHGTHCAGIAAAETNNGIGIAGLSWDGKIRPVKVLTAGGWGYWSWIAEGIIYAADNDARIISISIGGYYYSSTLENAVNYAYNKGCLIVASAGNENTNAPHYPSGFANAMAVSATDSSDSRAWWSNYGSSIEVAAPGVSILSTYWYYGSTYGYMSGTSMSTPYVAGLAAFILSRNPYLSNEQVREYIKDYADDLGSPGWDQYYGSGRINAYNGVNIIPILFVGEISEVASFPNPFKLGETNQVTIAFPIGMDVTVKIYNVIGQLVRTLDEEGNEIRKSKGEAYWDGRNDNGDKVSSGLYVYVIQGGGDKAVGKITLIK